jgi:ribosomal protein L40E
MGVLQFIIFGFKTRTKEHGPSYPLHCPNCDNDEVYHAFKQRRWFHIFWIPLIPWTADRALVCPTCGVSLELTKSEFESAKELANKARLHSEGELSADQYWREVRAFEAEASFTTDTKEVEATEDTQDIGTESTPSIESEGAEELICDECGARNPERALHCHECNAIVDERVK